MLPCRGRRFNDATLPFPFTGQQPLQPSLPSTLPFVHPGKPAHLSFVKSSPSSATGPSLEEQLRAASASPSVITQRLPPSPSDVATRNDDDQSPKPFAAPPAGGASSPINSVAEDRERSKASAEAPAIQDGVRASIDDEEDGVDPKAIDSAADPDVNGTATREKAHAPQVVHLPPKEVQEARLQETERKLEVVGNRRSV